MAHVMNYPGDVSASMVGLILQPYMNDELYEVVSAFYKNGMTRVELVRVQADDPREAKYDAFGQLRLIEEQ